MSQEPQCDRSACDDHSPGPCDHPDCEARAIQTVMGYCPVCETHRPSLPEPARGTCAHCYNHLLKPCRDCGHYQGREGVEPVCKGSPEGSTYAAWMARRNDSMCGALGQWAAFPDQAQEAADGASSTQQATDEIKSVRRVSKDAGDYVVRCPHCQSIIGIEGDDLSEIRGEQYQHRMCGGWLMVEHDARFVREL